MVTSLEETGASQDVSHPLSLFSSSWRVNKKESNSCLHEAGLSPPPDQVLYPRAGLRLDSQVVLTLIRVPCFS